jgi:hypothetical protein
LNWWTQVSEREREVEIKWERRAGMTDEEERNGRKGGMERGVGGREKERGVRERDM